MSESSPTPAPRGIDPRGPRFAAGITALLLIVDVFLGLVGLSSAYGYADYWEYAEPATGGAVPEWLLPVASVGERILDPGFLLLLVIALLFLWGVLSPRTAPWAALYRAVIAPRLTPPAEWEDPRPPRFAQGVGLFVATLGLVLHLVGLPLAIPIAAAMAFVAAFLSAAFGLCLGCQLYLLLQRVGLVGRARPATA